MSVKPRGKTGIEWTGRTWNPVTGCDKVSPGCKNCYAERMAERLQAMGQPNYRNGFKLTLQPQMLEVPLRWKKPRTIFVNSMSDLFHEDVPDAFIERVMTVVQRTPQHTYQILTKRADPFECPDVTLDGSGSTGANSTEGTNDDIVLYEWFLEGEKIAEGMTAQVELPVGTHEITLKVTDKGGLTGEDTVTITVQDTTAPVVTLQLNPPVLWPPNHQMRDIHAMLEIVEECDPEPVIELVSVTSNEPDNGLADGDTENDIQGVEIGTADMHFALRAKRQGMGNNRLYTVVYRVTDASGNSTLAEAVVTVPHDRGH